MKSSCDKNRVGIYLIYTFSLYQSRGVPSRSSSRPPSACNSLHTSTVSRKGKLSFVESNKSWGHQHVVHCVLGDIVAVETSSPSIHKKSRKTRDEFDGIRPFVGRPFIFGCVLVQFHLGCRESLQQCSICLRNETPFTSFSHWNYNGPCIDTWIWKCFKQCMQVLVIIVD